MRIETLPSPGMLANSILLRKEAAKAISSVEIFAGRNGGVNPTATILHTFFTACATAIAALRDLTAPTVVSRTQALGVNSVKITASEGLVENIVPATTTFVTSPVRTITKVSVLGKVVTVEYSGVALTNGNTIAYTAPATNFLRDAAGNTLATFGASAIVVA